jgi:hypothetical protein
LEPLDDVLPGVPAAFTLRCGDRELAAFDRRAFHGHVDLDVLACRGDADVPEPGLDDVELDPGLEQVPGVVCRMVCGLASLQARDGWRLAATAT